MRLLPHAAISLALARVGRAMATDELSHLSPESIVNLEQAENERSTYTTISLFSMPTFVLWCIFYLSAKLVEWALARYTKTWGTWTLTYILNSFYTAAGLALQLAAAGVFHEVYTLRDVHFLRMVAIIISVNYLFELIYKEPFRPPMLCHHFCTLAIILFLISAVQETQDPSIFVTAQCWFFHATTEQPMFIGLLMCMHNSPWEIAYSVICVIAMVSLIFIQFYGSSIVWKITDADLYRQKYEDYMSNQAGSGEVTRAPSLNGVVAQEKDADLADYGGSTSIACASQVGASAHELV
ncbi:hypothetical protein RQP46_001595 [Phenoliferia psychrophenolica]